MTDYDVLCIGFAVQDLVLEDIDNGALQHDSTYAKNMIVAPGGDAANQAAVLSGLGKKTALIAGFGYDVIGRQLEDQFVKEGIDISYSLRDGIEQSNLSVVVIKKDRDRSFLVGKGKGRLDVSFSDIDMTLLEHTKAVSLGSLYFLKNLDGGGAAQIFKKAREKGVLTFADMTADAYQIGPEGVAAVYPYTDYLMPSFEEAVYTSGYDDCDKIADYFLNRGVKNVILKLGDKGCFVKNINKRFYVGPYLIQPVDTTGCGDCFCAGFILGILEQMSIEKAAEFACAVGAVNAQHVGGHGNIQSIKQVIDFMNNSAQNNNIW